MAQQSAQQEPTMEEILASIRRIISEDADEGDNKRPAPTAETRSETVEVEAAQDEDEVLDLTEIVEEELPPPPAARAPEPPQPNIFRGRPEQPKPQPVVQEEEEIMLVDRDRDSEEGLLSSSASNAMASAFGQLAERTRVASDPTVTLEDMVRQMLKPMLKDWLDQNLPPLVERLVQEEIERATRQPARRR